MKIETIASIKRKINRLNGILNKKRNEICALTYKAEELEKRKYSGKYYGFYSGTVAKCVDGKFIGFYHSLDRWMFTDDMHMESKNIRKASVISEQEYKIRCKKIIKEIQAKAGL